MPPALPEDDVLPDGAGALPDKIDDAPILGDLGTAIVGLIAAIGAVLSAMAGPEPTGARLTDVVLTGLLTVVVVALGSRASSLALAVGAGVAIVAAGGVGLHVIAVIALALIVLRVVVARGTRPPAALEQGPFDQPSSAAPAAMPGSPARREHFAQISGAVVTLLVVQVLLRLPFEVPSRGSAVVAAIGMVPIAWSGWRRLPAPGRRIVLRCALVVVALGLIGALTGGLAGWRASSALADGVEATEDGLDAVRDGDQEEAERHLRRATADLESARGLTRAWWALPARHMPLVAPQMRALDVIADGGASTARIAADGADRIDSSRLRLVDGRLDPEVVADTGPILTELADGTAALRRSLRHEDRSSVWLLPAVADGRDRFEEAVADAEGSARTGALAAEIGPELLGADGTARYFVAFVTPSEARGTGFLGNYGLLTVTDGRIDLEIVGRNKDLNEAGGPNKTISRPDDYVRRYSRFEPESTWENVTMTPDGPTAARVMAELYEQSGGERVDGVMRIDPTGLSRLLRLTGPVEVEGLSYPLDAKNVVSFLEIEQYRIYRVREERGDMLGAAAEAVFDELTTGRGPAPARLARVLGPAVRGGNISLWLRSEKGERLAERLGVSGRVPPVRGDGFGVVTQNFAGNKVDAFLQRTIKYTATVDAETGRVTASAEVTLRNNAPGSGEPPYIISNLIDAPDGTNRTWVSVYSPLRLIQAQVDGQVSPLRTERELNRNVWSTLVDLAPGASVTLVYDLGGEIDLSSGRYRFDLLPQAMVQADDVTVELRVDNGDLARVTEAPSGAKVSHQDGGAQVRVRESEGTWALVAGVRRGR